MRKDYVESKKWIIEEKILKDRLLRKDYVESTLNIVGGVEDEGS